MIDLLLKLEDPLEAFGKLIIVARVDDDIVVCSPVIAYDVTRDTPFIGFFFCDHDPGGDVFRRLPVFAGLELDIRNELFPVSEQTYGHIVRNDRARHHALFPFLDQIDGVVHQAHGVGIRHIDGRRLGISGRVIFGSHHKVVQALVGVGQGRVGPVGIFDDVREFFPRAALIEDHSPVLSDFGLLAFIPLGGPIVQVGHQIVGFLIRPYGRGESVCGAILQCSHRRKIPIQIAFVI